MMDYDLEGAVARWRESENNQKAERENVISILQTKHQKYNLTELAAITGIKRTTLYYMLFGKDGKRATQQRAA